MPDTEALDLRMNRKQGVPASEWLQSVSVQELSWVLHTYGERANPLIAERAAEAVLATQAERGPYASAEELAVALRKGIGFQRYSSAFPEKVFLNAIRTMFLNSELDQLRKALRGAMDVLVPGGCCVVLTFKGQEREVVCQVASELEDPPYEAFSRLSSERLCELYPLVATDLDYAARLGPLFMRARPSERAENPRVASASIIELHKGIPECMVPPSIFSSVSLSVGERQAGALASRRRRAEPSEATEHWPRPPPGRLLPPPAADRRTTAQHAAPARAAVLRAAAALHGLPPAPRRQRVLQPRRSAPHSDESHVGALPAAVRSSGRAAPVAAPEFEM
ncbi:unnamed protein product [Prorocentrum cordatum]|uniref:Uncharacterized protein n=1 Tax=Prorocentrum cordatum TaxID=2364126 RepID=A0ABN9UU64_9DINO|nr:unnamed protein product [Polarella glacialis]